MLNYYRVRGGRGCFALQLLFAAIGNCTAANGAQLEVFHYLDRPQDTQRVQVLQEALKSTGSTWKDFTVAQGWSSRSEALLQQRVHWQNAPSAAMMKTPLILRWAAAGMLLPLDDIAASERWDDILPKPIADTVKYKGHYYAVPLNIHRVNWLWINERILHESGAKVPKTWDEFFVTAEAMKRAGYTAVAYHGSATENLLLFEVIALGVGGPRFYKKALIEYDPAELSSSAMEAVLRTYRRVKNYAENSVDTKISMDKRETAFQTGEVGMHIMGDWGNPAFYPAKSSSRFKWLCVDAPQTTGSYLFTSDAIAMFRGSDPSIVRAQQSFASALMSQDVQHDYSQQKGAIPARRGVTLAGYEHCALKSASTFRDAVRKDATLQEITMITRRPVEDAIKQLVFEFWQDDRLTPQQVMRRLVSATRQR